MNPFFIGGLAFGSMLMNVFLINTGAMNQTIHHATGDNAAVLRNLKDYLIHTPSAEPEWLNLAFAWTFG
ncbi:hypothetical protein RWE15_06410 [Virgibacillus halophilus]|uniref:Uncharacterized protein n=1 Tax=Tigheibacillus halophilus TaxID=361280 RepID=A0ABU5C5N6_9BACI|nr:hypothetical protein [Virgibacillus halophilus]